MRIYERIFKYDKISEIEILKKDKLINSKTKIYISCFKHYSVGSSISRHDPKEFNKSEDKIRLRLYTKNNLYTINWYMTLRADNPSHRDLIKEIQKIMFKEKII